MRKRAAQVWAVEGFGLRGFMALRQALMGSVLSRKRLKFLLYSVNGPGFPVSTGWVKAMTN